MTQHWSAGTGFVGGTDQFYAATLVRPAQANAAPVGVLDSVRQGASAWIGFEDTGRWIVRIHFIDFAATNSGVNVVQVSINGNLYIQALDCYALTQQPGTEVVRDIILDHVSGNMTIGFKALSGITSIGGIEIIPGSGHTPSPILTPPVTPDIPTGTFRGRYFPNPTLTAPSLQTTVETYPLLKDWGTTGPYAGFSATWSADFTGYFPFTDVDNVLKTFTFTAADNTDPTGMTVFTEAGGHGSYGKVFSNQLRLHCVGGTGYDGFVRANVAGTTLDSAVQGRVTLSTVNSHGPSMWSRNFGNYPGAHRGYAFGVMPNPANPTGPVNYLHIAKKDGIPTGGDPSGTWTVLKNATVAVSAGVAYYFRYETQTLDTGVTELRFYWGTTAWVPNVTAWSLVVQDSSINIAGGWEFYNGDHGYGATSDMTFDDILVTDFNGMYVADINVDDGGRFFYDDNKVFESWIQQAPTDYHPTFRNLTNGNHLIRFEYNNVQYTGDAHVAWRKYVGGTPVTPPVSGPTKLVMGVYEYGYSSWSDHFANLIGHDVPVAMIYWDLWSNPDATDFLGGGGGGNWLHARSDRRIVLGVSPMNVSHNWDNPDIANKMAGMAGYINSKAAQYGFSVTQVIIRFGYEGNGNWMPWGCGYADGTGNGVDPNLATGYIRCWKAAWNAFHPIAPTCLWDWSMTPWETGAVSFAAAYPGDAYVDIVSGDVYDDYEYSDAATNLATHLSRMTYLFDFADAHGKLKAIDESAVCKAGLGNGGSGDNPSFITGLGALMKARNAIWWLYFNVITPGVEPGWTLADAPASLAAMKTFVGTLT